MIAHCLFEQSGTFKNEFKKLGIEAYDYDILNDFGETDYVIDLFAEIESAYDGYPSIFDTMTSDDIIMAFFPCTRFEDQILLSFRGESSQMIDKWSDKKKLELDLKLHAELHRNYELITKLALVVLERNLKLVFENPCGAQHYLNRYWCLKPSIIHKNRRDYGDYYVKPTQFWFMGFEPKQNFVAEPIAVNEYKKVSYCNTVERSMISPDYARRFIQMYLL